MAKTVRISFEVDPSDPQAILELVRHAKLKERNKQVESLLSSLPKPGPAITYMGLVGWKKGERFSAIEKLVDNSPWDIVRYCHLVGRVPSLEKSLIDVYLKLPKHAASIIKEYEQSLNVVYDPDKRVFVDRKKAKDIIAKKKEAISKLKSSNDSKEDSTVSPPPSGPQEPRPAKSNVSLGKLQKPQPEKPQLKESKYDSEYRTIMKIISG